MLKFTKAAKINVFTSFWMNFQKMVKYLFSIIFFWGGVIKCKHTAECLCTLP